MGRCRCSKRQVAREAPAGVLAHEPKRLQRLDDFDPDRPDRLGHAVLTERVGSSHDELAAADPKGHEPVDDPEMRIHPEPGDELAFPVALEAVQDAAVIDIAVARGEVRHRQRRLMNREFVEGDDHGRSVRGALPTDPGADVCW